MRVKDRFEPSLPYFFPRRPFLTVNEDAEFAYSAPVANSSKKKKKKKKK